MNDANEQTDDSNVQVEDNEPRLEYLSKCYATAFKRRKTNSDSIDENGKRLKSVGSDHVKV